MLIQDSRIMPMLHNEDLGKKRNRDREEGFEDILQKKTTTVVVAVSYLLAIPLQALEI